MMESLWAKTEIETREKKIRRRSFLIERLNNKG
jgi:hypothetical protein